MFVGVAEGAGVDDGRKSYDFLDICPTVGAVIGFANCVSRIAESIVGVTFTDGVTNTSLEVQPSKITKRTIEKEILCAKIFSLYKVVVSELTNRQPAPRTLRGTPLRGAGRARAGHFDKLSS